LLYDPDVNEAPPPVYIGRYLFYEEVARGGMASVHFGRLTGPAGFSRTVAIKKLHPEFASDPEFVAMFLDEARLAARVRHPNVVSVLDVVASSNQVFLVMDYVQGESLARLARRMHQRQELVRPDIAVAIISGVLHGLHAAHETKDEEQRPLHIVHRDVSPQNVLLGSDGVARVVDFGVAKAAVRFHTTRDNQIKGKLPYMSPEQLRGEDVDRRTDVYSVGVLLWELLTGQRLFTASNQAAIFGAVLEQAVPAPSRVVASIPPELDRLVLAALAKQRDKRPSSARELAVELESAVRPATQREVGDWVHSIAGDVLERRAGRVAEIESHSRSQPAAPSAAPEGVHSQVSSISVSASPRASRPRRLRAWALAALLAIGVVVVLAVSLKRRQEPQEPAITAILTEPATSPSPPVSTELTPPPAIVSASPSTAPSVETEPRAPRAPTVRAPKPVGKKLPANCFTVDKDGVLHPKPECLK